METGVLTRDDLRVLNEFIVSEDSEKIKLQIPQNVQIDIYSHRDELYKIFDDVIIELWADGDYFILLYKKQNKPRFF